MKEAAKRLRDHLFGRNHTFRPAGFVGVGTKDIYVYFHISKKSWRGPLPLVWEGYNVKYRYNVGRAIPA